LTSPTRIHSALFTVALLFSANFIISKIAMREVTPLAFAWMRVAGAALLLWIFARGEPVARADMKRLILYGFLAVAVNQTLFLTGLAFTTVQVAAILITSIPVFTLGVAIAMKREAPTPTRIGGIALACAGALLVVGGEGFQGTSRSLIGAVMILINCFAYAIYLVISKRHMARLSAQAVVARMFVAGAVLLLPVAAPALWRQDWAGVSPRAWFALAVVILGPTIAAYTLQAWALTYAESSMVASYTYVQPILATLFAWAIFGEAIRPIVAVAAVMIFTGVWLAGRRRTEIEN
jgi:drug/metabolite transporter (DMT)-like permease